MTYNSIISVLILMSIIAPQKIIGAKDSELYHKIAKRIWMNECGANAKNIMHWNDYEEFASLGIGHFIWYPKGSCKIYEEKFPDLIQFFIKKDIVIPRWLKGSPPCPWKTKEDFLASSNDEKFSQIKQILLNTIDLQGEFIVLNFQNSLLKVAESAPQSKKKHVLNTIKTMAKTPEGLYAMIDYVNFKGSGISEKEKYNGKGWGLLQVFEEMPENLPDEHVTKEFVIAAKKVLKRRVLASEPKKNEKRWLAGWENRLNTYLIPL